MKPGKLSGLDGVLEGRQSPVGRRFRSLGAAAILLPASLGAWGQATPDVEQGMKPYGSYHGGAIDQVSLTNGNLILQAGLFAYSQRGGELAYPLVLRYNGKNFSLYQPPCPPGTKLGTTSCPLRLYMLFGPNPLRNQNKSYGNSATVGFEGFAGTGTGYIDTSLSFDGTEIYVYPVSAATTDGAVHQLAKTDTGFVALDGSGFASPAGSVTAVDRNGTISALGVDAEDRNGNQINMSSDGTASVDTLGRQIPVTPGPGPITVTPPASTASLGACPALNYAFQPAAYAYTWNLPTVNGGSLPFTLCYTGVYVRTAPGTPGPPLYQVSQNFWMLQSVVLPDSTFWAFEYDAADPNDTNSVAFGDLLKVTFPTGGSITYAWAVSTMGCNSGFDRAVQTRTVDANDGTGPHTWRYNNGIVTDPQGNDTVHTITALGAALTGGLSCSLYETQTQYYQGSHTSGTLLKTVNTDYQYTINPYDPAVIGSDGVQSDATTVTNVFPIRVTTTLPNGLVSKVETDYDTALAYHGALDGIVSNVYNCDPDGVCQYQDQTTEPVTNYTGSYGKPIAVREYDWGQGAPGQLLRQTLTTYQWQLNSAYLAANLLDLPASVQVLDGNNHQVSLTTYGYDEYGLNRSSVTTQFGSAPWAVRGNLTSVHRWLNGSTVSTPSCPIAVSNGSLVSYTQYNDTGTVYQSTDACGTRAGDPNHTTTHTYDSAYAGAYPTQTCNPLGQCVTGAYDFDTGLLTSFTDQNNQTSNFAYDQQGRMTQALGPTDPQSNLRAETDFDHSVVNQVKRSKRQDSSHWIFDYAYFDGVGRTKQTQLVDPEGDDFVDTGYDALGRVSTVSNPHRAASSPTDGVTTTAYDALGRTTQVTHPDGAYASTFYAGRAVQVSDEGNGTRAVQRVSQSDALGRLLNVCEVSSTTLAMGNGATPTACGLDIAATGFLTSYGYDTLGNLTSVSQGGYMPRSFSYDSLSRLLTAANPESGTITYTYDAAGDVITKTDARSITTTYSYDVLHRLLAKSYSDSTPPASFVYDVCPTGGCPSGVTPLLTTGRMVESAVANAQTFYSYHPMGWTINQWQCTPVKCGSGFYSLSYGYDLAGELTSSTNGLGTTLSTAYNAAAHMTGVTSNLSDATHPASLLSSLQYNPPGLPMTEAMGNSVSETLAYDNRLRLASLTATSPTAVGATPGTGTVTVNGTEGSRQVPATAATGSVTISGSEHSTSTTIKTCGPDPDTGLWECTYTTTTTYDTGTVTITVGGHADSVNYGQGDTPASIASNLANAINVDGTAGVNASASSGTVWLTARAAGSGGNLSLAASVSSSTSFTASASGSALTGGADAHTLYDSGTVTITVNGVATSASYGNGSTAASIASALAGGLNSGTLVNASANGNTITITSRLPGAASNYSLSVSSGSGDGFSPASFSASPSGTALAGGSGASPGTAYSFSMGYAPNGNVLWDNDSVNGNWSYGYDDFNRLVASNKNAGQQTYNYVYDRFGNRWQQNAPLGGNVFQTTFTGGNNRMDGASYDAAGNMTHDPVTGANYTYDAENRINTVNGGSVTYTYDADGQRVEKNVGGVKTDYVYDASGHAIAEIDGSGNVTRQELFAGGKHLGTYVNNTTYFSHGDWLGTERVRSDMTGAACETIQSLPYGDGQSTSGSCGDPSTRHFTGKERDLETGLDYFEARYYSNGLGRFTSPDPAGSLQPDSDPQTLNLYAYSLNNPSRFGDDSGFSAVDRVNRAASAVGLPYGGKGPDSYDCSGLASFSAGKDVPGLPNSAATQYMFAYNHGDFTTDPDQAQPGDEVFFQDKNGNVVHVGVVESVDDKTGAITMVEAAGHARGVVRKTITKTKAGSAWGTQTIKGYGLWHTLDQQAQNQTRNMGGWWSRALDYLMSFWAPPPAPPKPNPEGHPKKHNEIGCLKTRDGKCVQ